MPIHDIVRCPNCGSVDFEVTENETDDELHIYYCICQCNQQFVAIFEETLVDVRETG